jgi:hypothetical protein
MRKYLTALVLGVLALSGTYALGDIVNRIPYVSNSCAEASQIVPCLNGLVNSANTSLSGLGTPALPKNLLDNGAMNVKQRGTGTQTCGTTTIPASAYSADRWGCNVNVGSGNGVLQVVTTNVVAPFTNAELFYRGGGALLQPQCVMQEIPSTRIIPLQGTAVSLSFYAYALAAMVTDNGGVMTAQLFTGTGTDEGLQTFTASPAITPAFTGIATQTATFTLGTTMSQRATSFQIPATAKEAALALCWTPTSASGAGVTDGFEFTGVQLEPGTVVSPFVFYPFSWELMNAQTYYAQWADSPAATFTLPGTCTEITSGTTAHCILHLPMTMRVTPVVVIATATSFGMTKVADGTAEACSTLAAIASSSNLNSIKFSCAASETAAVGTMHIMLYAATGAANTITVSADF